MKKNTTATTQIFPATIASETEKRADALLTGENLSPTKEDVFALWQMACAYDAKDPNVLTHTFSSENEYAVKAKELKEIVTGSKF
jgi:hypothetical protein